MSIERCPCCGGSCSVGTMTFSSPPPIYRKDGEPRTKSFFVHCQICQTNNNGIVHGYETEQEAVEAWNKRV